MLMAKIKIESFLLSDDFKGDLTLTQLELLSVKYKGRLKETNLLFHGKETLNIMLWAKREVISFGPYQNLTFFEISNRIYSDLVLLEAAAIILKREYVRSIQLNLSNKGGNDMTIIDENGNIQIGEAFNTATSFFQIKLRSDISKFKEGKTGYIAFNKTALDEKNKVYYQKKKENNPHIEFIVCDI
jgi:hypothetical protein